MRLQALLKNNTQIERACFRDSKYSLISSKMYSESFILCRLWLKGLQFLLNPSLCAVMSIMEFGGTYISKSFSIILLWVYSSSIKIPVRNLAFVSVARKGSRKRCLQTIILLFNDCNCINVWSFILREIYHLGLIG